MEPIPKIFSELQDFSDANKARQDIITFMKEEMCHFASLSDDTYRSAYTLAGLMATDYVRTLPEEDPIVDILSAAGELEITPPESEDLRKEILQKVESL
jgi:hypothetical protein